MHSIFQRFCVVLLAAVMGILTVVVPIEGSEAAVSRSGTNKLSDCQITSVFADKFVDVFEVPINGTYTIRMSRANVATTVNDPQIFVFSAGFSGANNGLKTGPGTATVTGTEITASMTKGDLVALTNGSGGRGYYNYRFSGPQLFSSAAFCPQVITFSNPGAKTYGDSPFTVQASSTGGVVTLTSSTTSFCTASPLSGQSFTVTLLAVGTCTLTASRTNNAPVSHSFSISQKRLLITGLTATKEYDRLSNAPLSGTAALAGVVGTDDVTLSGTPAGTFISVNAGNKTVTVTGLSLVGGKRGNYSLGTTINGTITRKALAASISGTVMREYGMADVVPVTSGLFTLTGVITGDVGAVSVSNVSGVLDSPDLGSRTVTIAVPTLSGDRASNYSLAGPISGQVSVTQVPQASPILYYNFSDRDSAYTGNSVVTNLGNNASHTGSKIGTLTHDDATGKLAFSGGTNANGPYIDVADISTTQFADNGITIDFEADFGTADNWERLIDFGAAPAGTVSSNMFVGRQGTTDNLRFEILDGTVSLGSCTVVNGLLNTNFARWTISVDGTNCRIYKDGVAQTTSVATTGGGTATVTSAWTAKPKSGVTWNSNFIGRSNWTDDAQLAGNVRSLRMWAGVFAPAQAGAIAYRTVNFDANYSGSGSLTSRYTSGKTTLQVAPTRTGHVFGGWYDNAVAASGTLVGGAGAVFSPTTSPASLFASWVANVPNPVIVSQPSNITKAAGQTATFSVNATASGTASYQWQVSNDAGVTWANVSVGTGANTQSYTTAAVSISDDATKYRVNVTNTVGASAATLASSAATLTVGLESVDVNFDELNFDYSNIIHVVGTNGKLLGNKVLFLNVFTRDGIQVDALVTTELLTSATVLNYEAGARAGGANSYFQMDVGISAVNGFAQFKFDFYKHGVAGATGNPCTVANPTCASAVKVSLQNVNVSAIDIDGEQWNDLTGAESYTMAGNTQLKECVIPNTGTCTVRAKPSAFPADMRFQGSPTPRDNDPVDMAIVTYGAIDSFRIKFGRATVSALNYFGVAFKALDWGSTTPQTQGGSQYVMSYNGGSADSGAQTGTHTGAVGTTFSIFSAGTFVKAGHSFAGWATSSTATVATYAGSDRVSMPGSNLTLYAVWIPIKYTLTYSANGGTAAPSTGSYVSGTSVTLQAGPTRAGYIFGGWDTVINSGTGNVNKPSGDPYSMPSSNTTLYAKWTIADGTLVYDGNSGITTEASVVAAGLTSTTIVSGANTMRSGYDFVGWNSEADGTGTSYAVGSTVTLTAAATNIIYAQWALSKYNLVFNVNGGVGSPQSQSYVQGATTAMPTNNPNRRGFTFGGWNSAANGLGTPYSGAFLMPGNNLTLYAKWTEITYSVTYSNNSATAAGAAGAVSDSATYVAAASVTVKTSTGLNYSGTPMHRFIGWNTAANGSGADYLPGATFSMPVGGVTLFAQWLDSSVEIVYSGNGGTGAPANDNAQINIPYAISDGTPTRPGYTFDGWILSDSTPGGTYKIGGTTFFSPNDNFETLVAQWTAVNYTVTYNSDSGSTAPAQLTAKHIGDTIEVDATEPTKSGYTFLGWKDAAGNIYTAGGSFILGAGNVTLTAQWQGNAYALTYDANGGIGAPIAETRNFNAIANLSGVEPTRTGYTFQGWNTKFDGNGTVTARLAYQMPSANTTLFAQWTVNNFLLAYNTQGGSAAPSSASKDFDSAVTVNANAPTRTGHTFSGWNTAASGNGTTYLSGGTFKMPNANVTLYAQWTKTAFTLFYNTNGGQGIFSSQPVKYSERVLIDSTTPTKIGYTFSGWNTAADGTSGNDHSAGIAFTLNVESNVTLFATWTPSSYTVAYNANAGSGAPAGGTHQSDALITIAAKGSMAQTDFRFIGWNTRADGTGTTYVESSTFKMPAENVILYAQWISSLYQIAYNANGGQGGPEGVIANEGTTYSIDSLEPIRPGYTFIGWKLADSTPTNALLKANSANSSFVVAGNELLIAHWEIKERTVIYDLNGGSSINPPVDGSGNFDANITLASSAGVIRGNFAFVGWSTLPDGTGTTYVDGSSFRLPADNVILYAKWAPIYYIIDYNPAGGTGEPADQFASPSQSVEIAAEEPIKEGYEFEKWTEVSQGTDFVAGSSLIMPSSNVTLVASYTLRAASVPSAGSNTGSGSNPGTGTNPGTDPNTGVVDPGVNPVAKPKQLVLSVYFKGDSPVLTASTKLMLRRLAAKAKSYGRANNITIHGRVKETNDKSYDLRLSKARAANVSAYLKKFGVTGVFKVDGKGISPENTAKSRRVDLKLWWSN